MQRVKIYEFWRSGLRALPGTLLVGLVTFICYGLGLNLTATGFLYLIVVVLQSLLGDFVSSAVVSIFADLCLNFFFVPPLFSFRVSDSSDILALSAFLITGLVITRLMTQVRQEAETSELQRTEMKLLYELTQTFARTRSGRPVDDKGGRTVSRSVPGPRRLPIRRNQHRTPQRRRIAERPHRAYSSSIYLTPGRR
jgi:K+-sensing histidine kinase KdpD